MTTRRLILSLGASGAALALAAAMAVRSFPLEAQSQPQATSGEPVQIVKGGEHLLHGELPEYPHRAIEARVEGDVLLDLAVDDRGEVSDARVLSGPDELRKAALEAVLAWHYAPSAVSSVSTQATLRFHLPAPNAEFRGGAFAFKMARERENGELSPGQKTERLIMEIENALADPKVTGGMREDLTKRLAEAREDMAKIQAQRELVPEGETVRVRVRQGSEGNVERSKGPLRLVAVRTERVSEEAVSEVLKRAGVKVGDTFTEETLKMLRSAAAGVDEHLRVGIRDDGQGGITVTIVS